MNTLRRQRKRENDRKELRQIDETVQGRPLVMKRDGLSFKQAAKSLGAWRAGSLTHQERLDLARQKEKRQEERARLERAAHVLEQAERDWRCFYRDQIHTAERVLAVRAPWNERQWRQARAACVVRDEYALPAYTLLAFGSIAQRTRFVLHPNERNDMIAAVREAGGVNDDDGHFMEVSV